MASNALTVFVLLGLSGFLTVSYAIQCYECTGTSETNSDCDRAKLVECSEDSTCTMIWANGQAMEGGCNGRTFAGDGCYDLTELMGKNSQYVVCTTEKCNAPEKACENPQPIGPLPASSFNLTAVTFAPTTTTEPTH